MKDVVLGRGRIWYDSYEATVLLSKGTPDDDGVIEMPKADEVSDRAESGVLIWRPDPPSKRKARVKR